jgi:hypothetical protein
MDNTVIMKVHAEHEHQTVCADTVPRKHGRKKPSEQRTNKPIAGQDPKFDEMYQQLAVMQKQLNTMKRSMLASVRATPKLQSTLAQPDAPTSPPAASVSADCAV